MIEESCEVPREDLDEGFNPCRKQVVVNGELCQYAHMYDVMNERYDREEDTSYLNSVKRDKITSTTPVLLAGNNTQIYANSTNGEGRVNMLPSSAFNNPENHTEASIPSAKAVADYVAANIPDVSSLEAEIDKKQDKLTLPLPVSLGGTGVSTRKYVAPDKNLGILLTTPGISGEISSWTTIDALSDYTNTNKTQPEIATAFANHIATAVEDNDLLPTNALMIDYVAGAVADYAPIPLPVSKGGTGGNTPYVTDDLDNSAIFVMHDAPNDRYDAAPMSALTGYLDTQYLPVKSKLITPGSDLNEYKTSGNYSVLNGNAVPSIINKPVNLTTAFNVYVFPVLQHTYYIGQQISTFDGTATYYRYYDSGREQWSEWTLLYPTPATTVPDKFYYAVSPFPSGNWEGEMTVNVTPVFSVKIAAVTYVLARVYAYKRFNYTGTADNINLFTSLKPVGDYTGVFSDSTRIPLTFNVFGRSNTDGEYGLTSKGSAANLSLNFQTVPSVFNLGNFDISSNLKCVFGKGSNTPGVAVSVDCMALMWHSVS